MTSEITGSSSPEPELLQRVEHCARRVKELDAERDAEAERRDRLIAEAEAAGHTYRALAAAARRGDGQATVSLVRHAILKYG